ncbi:hypothetical protein F4778DRAFT_721889 [Xylariomycetidae sp. FL2044]|nr:hypothetical protein F4778DRAFT_721889 [Xylariomycetidae sp. FL2044]
MATAGFKMHSRMALTGSPLANNVEEYFAMIGWATPKYLGDIEEFWAEPQELPVRYSTTNL